MATRKMQRCESLDENGWLIEHDDDNRCLASRVDGRLEITKISTGAAGNPCALHQKTGATASEEEIRHWSDPIE